MASSTFSDNGIRFKSPIRNLRSTIAIYPAAVLYLAAFIVATVVLSLFLNFPQFCGHQVKLYINEKEARYSMSRRNGRRIFTKEFKEEIVRLITSEGCSASEVARDFDIHRSVVCRWVREYRYNSDSAFPGRLPADEEIRRLKRE